MRKKTVAGNWKMNLTKAEGLLLLEGVVNGLDRSNVEVIVAPSYPFITDACRVTEGTGIAIAAQNCHHERSGAYTGEVSAEMLASFGCRYVLVGHSERRQYFAEDDELVNKKIMQLLANGISPIYCCGERQEQREEERHLEVVENQIQTALQGFTKEQLLRIVVAYEPVWAIGTGLTANPDQAQEMHAFIRHKLAQVLGNDAQQTRILYGGSVKPSNAKALFSQPDIDGGLIGGASLNVPDFLAIIHSF